jgi:hypothetical protein
LEAWVHLPEGDGPQFRTAGGHYDVYEGGASFDDVIRVELEFLHRHAKISSKI